ncbi:transposase family protein [Acinetobacter baumannii 1295743]|uniref:Transposase family protein n=1 Tax=Acinetobacter baumannii (strain 1295743) TaxID=1310613 RepID=A0A009IKE7_ACIB9|nr:transposase family protein [Acinetobacter baumannii 1295743]
MSSKRYPEEFKIEAVKQVTEKGHSVAEVAVRLGTTTHSLYAWIKRYDPQQPKITESNNPSTELAKLKKELQGVKKKRKKKKKPGVSFKSQSK